MGSHGYTYEMMKLNTILKIYELNANVHDTQGA